MAKGEKRAPGVFLVALGWGQLALGILLLAWSFLAVFEAPVRLLWVPAVAATEWGHVFALVALVILLLPGWRTRTGKIAAVFLLVASGLFLSPLVRAVSVARDLPERVNSAFGDAPHPNQVPRTNPLVFGDLFFSRAVAQVKVTPCSYPGADGEARVSELWTSQENIQLGVVIAIHGGSWSSGDQRQLPAINRFLASRGYAVLAISYALAPDAPFPAALDDVLCAVKWVKQYARDTNLDATRIVLMGRSAGAHLALLAGYRVPDPAIVGIIAYYPPTDLVWSFEHPSNPLVFDSIGVLTDFMGGTPQERPTAYFEASPLEFVGAHSPPTLLMHGGRDELVSKEQSERLSARLAQFGVPRLLLQLPWATHGFDANPTGPSGQLSRYAIEQFLLRVCGPTPAVK